MSDQRGFIQELPKAELHLHIEGTLEPEMMLALGERNAIALPYDSIDDVRAAYAFDNLQQFLDLYYQGADVLRTAEDFYDLTVAYLGRMRNENVRHVEIFFDPQTHTERGIAFDVVFEGIDQALREGREEFGISSELIMCFLRHLSAEEAHDTLQTALPYRDKIIGVGLDSSELGHPPEKFKSVFDAAREAGFLTVAHAGEEGPAQYIRDSIELLGVSRIDHGVRCIDDHDLLGHLVQTQLPLTVCPLSNTALKVFDKMSDHNIKMLYDLGVCVTINSDDPAYFGGYLSENYAAVADAFSLKARDLAGLAINGFEASFLAPEHKARYREEIIALLL